MFLQYFKKPNSNTLEEGTKTSKNHKIEAKRGSGKIRSTIST